jgi:hypothetical protein
MRVLTAFLSVILLVPVLFAGNTGKIAGTIKDKKTGEPLIGVNVRIDGHPMGAASDFDGRYSVMNIPPGDYIVVATFIGYQTVRVTDIRVKSDLTTTIDVEMSETVLELGQEVVIIAERPLVQKDLTAKTAIVSGKEIAAMPVTEVGAVLSLQAGFVAGSLRGGRSGEVAYWIDGVPVTDGFNGGQVVEVNKSLVQELQLVSGAFNAEYGQAMSGIVNISTKEGGRSFTGGLGVYFGDYVTKDKELFPGTSFNPSNIHNYEGNLSGPILGDDLTFFANLRYIYFNGYLNGYRRFHPNNIGYMDAASVFHISRDSSGLGDGSVVPMSWSRRAYGQGKLTWRIAPTAKLTGNYIYDFNVSKAYNRSYFYNPDGIGNNYNGSHTAIMQFSHTLNNSTFYTIGGSFFLRDSKYYLYDLQYRDSVDVSGKYLGAFEVVNPNGPRYVSSKLFSTASGYSFLVGGTDLGKFHRSTQTALVKVDLTSQVDATNMVKLGLEYRQHLINFESTSLLPLQEQGDIDPTRDSPFIRTRIVPLSEMGHDFYEHRPRELAAYIQDKMEFSSIIVNIGVRFDYFAPDGHVLKDPSDPNIYVPIKPGNRFRDLNNDGIQQTSSGEDTLTVTDRRAYWYRKATNKFAVSPRLGVSFPITATGIVHFSYGHFFQVPRFERLYENPDFKLGSTTGNVGVIGNADLEPERTVSAELGVQQQLTEDLAIDVTAYLRDFRGLTGTRGEEIVIFGGTSKYTKYINSDFGFAKGLLVTVDKRFTAGMSARLDYTYQLVKGSASDPQEAQRATTSGARPEVQLNPLGWDQRHTLNLSLMYAAPGWGVSTIAQYGSGTPYTPSSRTSNDISVLLTNIQTKPAYLNVDVRTYYEMEIMRTNFTLYARIFNLFDIRNEVGVFDDTGRAGSTRYLAEAQANNPDQSINTVAQWYRIATNYSEPRRVEFGMNVEF